MSDETEQVIERFKQLEDIELRRDEATDFMKSSFDVAAQSGSRIISTLCELPQVRDEILGFTADYQRDREDLSFLLSQGDMVDEGQLDAAAAQLEERGNDVRLRIAERFFEVGPLQESVVVQEGESPDRDTSDAKEFFMRTPGQVAEQLKGKTIQVGSKKAEVVDTLPQDAAYNKKWSSDPIFGEGRVDAMVGKYRGNAILYVRAGSDEEALGCVRIVAVKIGTKVHKRPAAVCRALGLTKEVVADIQVDGDTIVLKNQRAYNK